MYLAQLDWDLDPLKNNNFKISLGRGTYNEEG